MEKPNESVYADALPCLSCPTILPFRSAGRQFFSDELKSLSGLGK
jgi:hypothetical protein